MRRRSEILLLIGLLAGASGCAGTARRDDGTSIFGPRAWNTPPAPPQRPVTLTSASTTTADPSSRREGLSKYFPGLNKKSASTTGTEVAATKYRPTWFGLRPPKSSGDLTYMSDPRGQLNRSGPSPTALPVALQVPSDRASSDRLVMTTAAETTTDGPAPSAGSSSGDSLASSTVPPDFGGKPSRPGEDEVNPLPPAAEPGTEAAIANRMPQVPLVDPLADASASTTASRTGSKDDPASDDLAVKASTPEAETTEMAQAAKSTQSTAQVKETSKVVLPPNGVYPSPQAEPPKPTSQVKPSPQAQPTAHTWKRPCLRRLVRKVCKMGEFADPPTAAPH